jgi:hypothetical protein
MVEEQAYQMMDVTLSLKKVVDSYHQRLESETNNFKKLYLSSILQYADDNEELIRGIDPADRKHFEKAINILLSELFPEALTHNEIKAATVPFSDLLFNKTERLNKILKAAGKKFKLEIMSTQDFNTYRMVCGLILNTVYDRNIDFSQPIFCEIPDANNLLRTYRVTYNADFIDVELNDEKNRLDDEKIKDLLRNPDDEDMWYKYFPVQSYTFKGFGIVSMADVTMDVAISDLKTVLLSSATNENPQMDKIELIFRNMFNLDNLRVGFTSYDQFDENFETMFYDSTYSFILGESHEKSCSNALCHDSYKLLIEKREPLVITDVHHYDKKQKNKFLTDNLRAKNVKSAILYPITNGKQLIGILEVVSKVKYALNTFNVNKIDNVAKYLTAALTRSEQEYQNSIKALIQTECTSIHSSVQWKFAREARRILKARSNSDRFETFKDVRFPDIYPLYGQIDIVGSSDARNDTIKKDLVNQLDIVCDIFAFAKASEPIPIYDQISFRVIEYQKELKEGSINADSERDIIKLLTEEINPVVQHLKKLSPELSKKVADYEAQIDPSSGVIYNTRNTYDDTVQSINEALSNYIDRKQIEAQTIFPHFFERFKTDGVEHNIYVGSSIAPSQGFNVVYLYNLRLWQLKTMIEMENKFYAMQDGNQVVIDAASMILVFDNTLSIRYRIDEKRFDVDGTYNARYEVIKKRIDKANIKGTEERITQKGKIAIIYTNKETEREYQRYVNFLQSNGMLGDDLEHLELEDVQGVIGLKALRVNILYSNNENQYSNGNALSYDDLINQSHLEH